MNSSKGEKINLKLLGKWPHAKYVRLFELFKVRPYLWKKSNNKFCNNRQSEKDLDEIGKELGCSGEEAKLRFRSMKQTYFKTARRKAQNGGSTETQWRFAKQLSFLESENTQNESINNMNMDFNKDDTVIDLASNSELSECSYSQPPFNKYAEVFEPECIGEQNYSERRQTELEYFSAPNNSSSALQAFSNGIAKQLETFPEEEAYQLMADIQTLVTQRKVALIRKAQTTNDQLRCASQQNESNVSNIFIKEESANLNEY